MAWFTKPQYVQSRDRPLLLDFGPMYVHGAPPWSAAFATPPIRPAFYALRHLCKQAGADGRFHWIHTDPWKGAPTSDVIRRRIGQVFTYFSKDLRHVIVFAYPGFNDVYAQHLLQLDYHNGDTLRQTLDVDMVGPWPLIQLVTWNDYRNGTMIEPTHEFGYTLLEIVQQARRKESGKTFP